MTTWRLGKGSRRRFFLMLLMGYSVFYLSGTKSPPTRTPHYSYTLGEDGDAVGWDPVSLWKQSSLADLLIPSAYRYHANLYRGIAESKATGLAAIAGESDPPMPRMAADLTAGEDETRRESDSRQLTRALTVHLLALDPVTTADKIQSLAKFLGGYVVTANTGQGGDGEHAANIIFRVPVSRLEAARTSLSRLAIRVESERTEATDVTREFVDREATLRNYRAEEFQYLSVLKRATAVKDILEVSGRLRDVRGRIEKLQGEVQYLSQQVDMAVVTAYVDAESQAHIFGMRWRPVYRIKGAAHDAIEALGEYGSLMAAFLLHLPAILLWLVTVVAGTGAAWRLVRWLIGRCFADFRAKSQGTAGNSPAASGT